MRCALSRAGVKGRARREHGAYRLEQRLAIFGHVSKNPLRKARNNQTRCCGARTGDELTTGYGHGISSALVLLARCHGAQAGWSNAESFWWTNPLTEVSSSVCEFSRDSYREIGMKLPSRITAKPGDVCIGFTTSRKFIWFCWSGQLSKIRFAVSVHICERLFQHPKVFPESSIFLRSEMN